MKYNKPPFLFDMTEKSTTTLSYLQAFIEDPNNPPDIWAHKTTPKAINLFLTTGAEARMIRSNRQFGYELTSEQVINDGIGPFLETAREHSMGLVYPNRLLKHERLETKIAGMINHCMIHHCIGFL